MPDEPQIAELSYEKRKIFFWLLFIVFVLALPSMIFYTTGYRLSFENEETTIVSTGGIYITTDNLEVDVYLDEKQVEKPRLFRSAYYIQDIEVGQHRVVVQGDGLHTWVKELPVDSHIVIEASAFNLPVVTQLRPITPRTTTTGVAVYAMASTTALKNVLSHATITEPYIVATTTAARSFVPNEEYTFVQSLFGTTTSARRSVFVNDLDKQLFGFATTTTESLVQAILEPKESNGIVLLDHNNEVYAVWQDDGGSIPHYFCITGYSSTTAERYGQQMFSEVNRLINSTTTPMLIEDDRLCRPEVKIDRQGEDVFAYDFFPGSSDLVILTRESGLYVTEIDDRAWQNTQPLYQDAAFDFVIENNNLYIKDEGAYFELVTEIEEG